MNLLLDTHALLWALEDDPTLSDEARGAITDEQLTIVTRDRQITRYEVDVLAA